MNTLQDKIRGSLIGGAIGDALGYPVEFIKTYKGIQEKYGERGITRLVPQKQILDSDELSDKAVVSDDTQMTLFTANGLLNAKRLKINPKYAICLAYIEWYLTQIGKWSNKYKDCWIARIPELNKRRGPGHTCMTALYAIYKGQEPYNTSKGDGGVMRVAPIPLFALADGKMTITDSDRLAGDAAEITHQHPLGFIPAALVAHIIYRLAEDEMPTRQSLVGYIHEGMEAMEKLFTSYPYDVKYMGELADKAIALADNDKTDVTNIESIGGGWTGEEALAIALYCAVRHFDNFEEALIAAVNHAGDSDSTGAITGNILGAAIGYDAIPQFFLDDLELHDVILQMADDLYKGNVTYSRLVLAYLDPDPESTADIQKRYQQTILEWVYKSEKTRIKENATKDTQYIQSMEEHVVIPMDLYIPDIAWTIIRQGHISHCMEDYWFMYCDASAIRYFRSWTGCCVFVAAYENVNDGIHIYQLQSRRVPNRPNPMFDKEDVALFLQLLMEDLSLPPFEAGWDVVIKKKEK